MCAAQPSAELQRYFDAAGPEVGAGVMAQLAALAAAVFPPAPPPPAPAFMQTSVALEHQREVRPWLRQLHQHMLGFMQTSARSTPVLSVLRHTGSEAPRPAACTATTALPRRRA